MPPNLGMLVPSITRLGREAGGDPPHFSRSFARGGDGAVSGFEEGRDLLRGALVPRSVKNARVRRGRANGGSIHGAVVAGDSCV